MRSPYSLASPMDGSDASFAFNVREVDNVKSAIKSPVASPLGGLSEISEVKEHHSQASFGLNVRKVRREDEGSPFSHVPADMSSAGK